MEEFNNSAVALATTTSTNDVDEQMENRSITIDQESKHVKIADRNKKEYIVIPVTPEIKVKGGKIYAFNKRLFDIIVSFIALIVLSPLLLITGLLVKITSKGPIIYVSKRIGKNGKIFNFYKFRSMYQDAEARLEKLKSKNEIKGGVTFKMKNDPRITPFGKFIRKTSIDELPQLWNVIKGDLSLVGPRSSTYEENLNPKVTNHIRQRQLVSQGITGEWQTHGRSSTTYEEMIEMDLDYIQNKRGFFYDIKLLFLTVWVVLTGKGAE